jgi:hypothetical protein
MLIRSVVAAPLGIALVAIGLTSLGVPITGVAVGAACGIGAALIADRYKRVA